MMNEEKMEQEVKETEAEVQAEQADEKTPDAETASEQNAEAADQTEAEATEEKKEDEDLLNKFNRLAADFQNFKRRSEKEKSDIYAYANEKFAVDLLDVMDNFDRAMAAAPADDKFAEGMQLILKQLGDVLAKNNVAEIEAEGKTFDPNFHNAVMTEAAAEGVESGTVTKVFQKGYTLNGKVIRPSMVAVAQ